MPRSQEGKADCPSGALAEEGRAGQAEAVFLYHKEKHARHASDWSGWKVHQATLIRLRVSKLVQAQKALRLGHSFRTIHCVKEQDPENLQPVPSWPHPLPESFPLLTGCFALDAFG